MRTKFLLGIFLITALLVGGCASSPDSQMVNEQLAQILTQSALAQPSATAPLPTVTATEVTPPPPTPPPAGGALTATPDATLKITSITETAPGRAVVNWEAVGNFPAGFTIVWTTETRKPLYPGDDAIFAGDPNARSAMMSGLTGKVYIVSVCRTSVSGCDVYSDPAFFVFTNYAPTPTINWTQTALMKTAFANIGGGGGGGGGGGATATPTPGVKFAILSIIDAGNLKARMTWTSDVSPDEGFRIYYSTLNKDPKQNRDLYFVIEDGDARIAYVNGLKGTTYYYRVCKMDNGKCVAYTPMVQYKYPGTAVPTITPSPTATKETSRLLIATIEDTSIGKARITWAADGTFPEGFKVLYSPVNAKPDLADIVFSVPDAAQRTAEISGTPNVQYYFRMCKFVSGACVLYSPVVSFRFAAPAEDPSFVLTLDPTVTDPGNVRFTWDALSPAPAGLMVMWLTSPGVPAYPANVHDQIAGDTTGYLATGLTSGVSYTFRLCKYDGSICTAYSATVQAIVP